ncbi:MAG: ATP-dependent zinc metalloprotease FtsH [Gemmataceae bacterium]|nr:ATP-dependent zinc metalloprotease FtsH [Gemmataceae bacterium]MDW8266513.1 ATP-dependent zinc metalloprotease FtsH [Gemmataceae bacterium]
MPPRSTPPSPGPARRRPSPGMPNSWIWLLILGTAVVGLVVFLPLNPGSTLPFSDFYKLLEAKKLSKVTFVGTDRIVAEVTDPHDEEVLKLKVRNGKFTTLIPHMDDRGQLIASLRKANVQFAQEEEHGAWLGSFLAMMLPTLLVLAVIFLFLLPRFRDPLGGSFLSAYIKSPARRYERSKMRVTFDDVADMENAKRELQEIVDFLKYPDRFQRLGAQVPKGVLLVGPPGTGKTLLARAVAGEAGVPFYSISGSEFIQMFVGVGASRVRDMFKTAKENAPCLLFIDEIDAVGRMRGAGVGGGSDEREQTLNQILSEMDGFQPNEMVIVLAATNRPDVLDSALLRPGRFDRHITIDRPTWQGRLAILKVHTRNKPLADDVNLEYIARKMIGMTGADLRNLVNEAALLATREGKSKIERVDFERAADRVIIGPKREEVLSPEDKRRTAYHEAGHALVAWLEPAADKPLKVSIIPRGRSLGVNVSVPDEERFNHGLDYFKARLVTYMGGRAADRLIYGQPEAGAEMDLKQATRLARYMVTHWGMSERLGPMSFRIGEEHVFLGKEIQEPRDFSEGTAQIIDEEVQRLLREADQRAYELLEKNRADLDRLAEALFQREEMTREEIEELLRGSPAPSHGASGEAAPVANDGRVAQQPPSPTPEAPAPATG